MEDSKLKETGKFLLSIFIPSLYLIPLVTVYLLPKDFGFGHRPLVYFGLTCAAIGLGLWIWAMIVLGNRLAVFPGAKSLALNGIYKYFRHPIYVGITLTLFGMFLACGSTFGMTYLVLVVLPLNWFRATKEEQALLEQFGEDYRNYRKKTLF